MMSSTSRGPALRAKRSRGRHQVRPTTGVAVLLLVVGVVTWIRAIHGLSLPPRRRSPASFPPRPSPPRTSGPPQGAGTPPEAVVTTGQSTTTKTRATLMKDLQQSPATKSPWHLLDQVGRHVHPQLDPDGSLASLVLIRLSKQLVAWDNQHRHLLSSTQSDDDDDTMTEEILQRFEKENPNELSSSSLSSSPVPLSLKGVDSVASAVVQSLASCDRSNLEALVEGTKACAVISRLLVTACKDQNPLDNNMQSVDPPDQQACSWYTCFHEPLLQGWHREAPHLVSRLEPHHLSGLKWAYDTWRQLIISSFGDDHHRSATPTTTREEDWKQFPPTLQNAYDELRLPFVIRPGLLHLSSCHPNCLSQMVNQINFRLDQIRTVSNRLVPERRHTAWQGDATVGPFFYAGKAMPRDDWSPLVASIRDDLHVLLGTYYDGCLINWYPDGESSMRYHIDPDQGTLWDYDTAVVSVGATRRFAFRSIEHDDGDMQHGTTLPNGAKTRIDNDREYKQGEAKPHTFVLMQGDVTHMFGDCQVRYQHTVKKADEKKNEKAARISLVFKKTWPGRSGP